VFVTTTLKGKSESAGKTETRQKEKERKNTAKKEITSLPRGD
jgi:hypothetical protein